MVLSSADFFSKSVFCCCFFSVILVECQADWIQIMPIGSDLGQIVCKGYQKTTLVSKEFVRKIQAN